MVADVLVVGNKSKGYFETFSAPTHALAIRWISVNYGKDKISNLKFDIEAQDIDNELIRILNCLDKN